MKIRNNYNKIDLNLPITEQNRYVFIGGGMSLTQSTKQMYDRFSRLTIIENEFGQLLGPYADPYTPPSIPSGNSIVSWNFISDNTKVFVTFQNRVWNELLTTEYLSVTCSNTSINFVSLTPTDSSIGYSIDITFDGNILPGDTVTLNGYLYNEAYEPTLLTSPSNTSTKEIYVVGGFGNTFDAASGGTNNYCPFYNDPSGSGLVVNTTFYINPNTGATTVNDLVTPPSAGYYLIYDTDHFFGYGVNWVAVQIDGSGIIIDVIDPSVSCATSIDSDAAAFITRLATAGSTLDSTQQTNLSNFVVSLKTAGIWSNINALYPFIGTPGSAAYSLNLKSTSYTASFTNLSFESYGVLSSGSGYVDTGFIPNVDNSYLSQHYMVYTTSSVGGTVLLGCGAPGLMTGVQLYPNYSDLVIWPMSEGLFDHMLSGGISSNAGFLLSSVDSSTKSIYHSGSLFGSATAAPTDYSSTMRSLWLLARNVSDTGQEVFSTTGLKIASVGAYLNSTQVSDFNTIVETFITDFGK